MKVSVSTELPEVVVLEPRVFEDERGSFFECYSKRRYSTSQIVDEFVQDNYSSSRRGVLRGLHYQHPAAQAKLIQVVHGEILDVVVDIRLGSPTFGQWEAIRLSGTNHRQVYVPRDFAHGFRVLSETAKVIYKVSDYYRPECEHTLLWNDPSVRVRWPSGEPCVSAKDSGGFTLEQLRIDERLPEYPM